MNEQTLRSLAMSGISVGVALLVASCSLPSSRSTGRAHMDRLAQRTPARHIEQLEFGQGASFGVCTEPACPSVTRKTLAVAADGVVPRTAEISSGSAGATSTDGAFTGSAVSGLHERHVLVLFAPGSAILTPSGKAALAHSLAFAHSASRIVISGRTDSASADAPNQALALARAVSVRDHLRQLDPTLPALMEIDARGRCCFIASNDTPQDRQQNRRVEIVFNVPGQVTP